MSRECVIAWGGNREGLRHEAHIASLEDLDVVLDTIELSAMRADCVYQVDLTLANLSLGDPIMLQFLIGHSVRSSLLWHEDGQTMIAVAEDISEPVEGIVYERYHYREEIEPSCTMITPSLLRDALSLYLMTDSRPECLRWIEAEAD